MSTKSRFGSILFMLALAGCQTPGSTGDGGLAAPGGTPEELAAQGLAAAKTGDTDKAITYLAAAVEQSGPNPANIFNLGLVQSQAGNYAAAAAWLRTYLAMAPDASNAPQVRREIRALDAKASNAVDVILSAALDAARRLPEVRQSGYAAPGKVAALESLILQISELGRPAPLADAKAEVRAVAGRLGYELFGNSHRTAFEPTPQWRMKRATALGDLPAAVDLWRDAKPGGDDWSIISPISNLADFAGFESVRAYDQLPPEMRDAVSPSLHYVVHNLGEHGFLDAAERLLPKVSYQKRELATFWLALKYLDAGRLGKATETARRCRNSSNKFIRAKCKGLAGDARALAAFWRAGEMNPFQPHVYEIVQFTGFFLRMGDVAGAAALQAILPGEEIKYGKDVFVATRCKTCKEAAGIRGRYMAALARIADGDFSGAEATIRESAAWNKIWRHAGFKDDVLGAALFQGKLDYAERFVRDVYPMRRHPALLRRVAERAAQLGEPKRASRLERDSENTLTRIRGGWTPRDSAHLRRTETWFRHALEIQTATDTGNLSRALAEARRKQGKEIVQSIVWIARRWDEAVERNRILEHYIPTHPRP